ncbi:MAG: hypothetical protein KY468_10065 [Armatimonadetes bacterium]|nr:hypothetical protein [Armatimonadota bacterium]
MASQPPKSPHRIGTSPSSPNGSNGGQGNGGPNRLQLENMAAPRHKKKKKTVPLADKIYRGMFVVGMIIGAFLSLMLPFKDYSFTVADRDLTLPFNVVKLEVWQRVLVYCGMVIGNGFLWSKWAMGICDKHFPHTRYLRKAPEEDVEQGMKLWRLDD